MKQRVLFLLKNTIFYFLFFILAKILFIIYNLNLSLAISPTFWIKSLWNGASMDLSMSSYTVLVYSALMAVLFFLPTKSLYNFFKVFNGLILGLFSLIITVDLEIYRNWGYHLDLTPLEYLKTPKDAAASSSVWVILLLVFLFLFIFLLSYKVYVKYVLKDLKNAKKLSVFFSPFFLLLGGFMIIPIRGGLGLSPMDASFVYYSSNIYANHIAMNPVWNFMNALDHKDTFNKDYNFLPDSKASCVVDSLLYDNTKPPMLLNIEKPNIIFIILESFSFDLLDYPQVVPNLSNFTHQGLFFENMYSPAARSDKGLSAIFSGYPAHPGKALMFFPDKVTVFPNLPKFFKRMGYYTSYYYGGDINFANMKGYMKLSRFDELISQKDYPSSTYGAKWGVHDQYSFERYFNEIKKKKRPFFNAMFSLSSHEPFDVPETFIKGNTTKEKFLNTAHYTDKYLGRFMDSLRSTPVWDSTLVIISADHGSPFIHKYAITQRKRYHIPVIWLGGALRKDSVISKYGMQTDIAATLLGQMGVDHKVFKFSKDLLSPSTRGFAYFSYPGEGAGFIDEKNFRVYDIDSNRMLEEKGSIKSEPEKAYLQESYQYFKEQ